MKKLCLFVFYTHCLVSAPNLDQVIEEITDQTIENNKIIEELSKDYSEEQKQEIITKYQDICTNTQKIPFFSKAVLLTDHLLHKFVDINNSTEQTGELFHLIAQQENNTSFQKKIISLLNISALADYMKKKSGYASLLEN